LLAHLRGEATARLNRLRGRDPAARLADAERDVAQAHGFRSWRALKAALERQASGEIRACTGYYRDDPARVANLFLTVRLEGGSLIVQSLSGAAMTLQRQADGCFAAPGLRARYGFVRDADGAVPAMTVDVDGRLSRLQRIDEAQAEAIRAAHRAALEDQARSRRAIGLPPEQLALPVGRYGAGDGPSVAVTLEDGRLFAAIAGQQKLALEAESRSDFFFPGLSAQLRFRIVQGRSVAMTLHQNGAVTTLPRIVSEDPESSDAAMARRFAEQLRPRVVVTLPADMLPRYAGRYRIDAARTLVVEAQDGALFAQITGQARYEIYAEAEDRFFWTVVPAQISFVDGGASAILHQGGRDMPLPRL